MSPRKTSGRGQQPNLADYAFQRGLDLVSAHPLFAPLAYRAAVLRKPGNMCPKDGWAVVTSNGVIHANPTRLGAPDEWAYALAHCLLHLGFGHFDARAASREWNDACDWFLLGFLRRIQIGRPPNDMLITMDPPATSEEGVYETFRLQGLPDGWLGCGAGGLHTLDMIYEPKPKQRASASTYVGATRQPTWQECFAAGLANAVARAVIVASGEDSTEILAGEREVACRARPRLVRQ